MDQTNTADLDNQQVPIQQEKINRFTTMKYWEDSRNQTSSIYKNILLSIHKNILTYQEYNLDYLNAIIKYLKDKNQHDLKYANLPIPIIPQNPFSSKLQPIQQQQIQLNQKLREFALYVETNLMRILENEIQAETSFHNNYKHIIQTTINEIDNSTKILLFSYHDYSKVYLESYKLASKNKEVEKDLYSYELTYITNAHQLHEQLKNFSRQMLKQIKQVIEKQNLRNESITEFFKLYFEKGTELNLLNINDELQAQKINQLKIEELVSQQEAVYILQNLNVNDDIGFNYLQAYFENYEIKEPHPNQLLVAKYSGYYDKQEKKVEEVVIAITIDKHIVVFSKKPIFTLNIHSVSASYAQGTLFLVESKKGLIGNSKTKLSLRCGEEVYVGILQYQQQKQK